MHYSHNSEMLLLLKATKPHLKMLTHPVHRGP